MTAPVAPMEARCAVCLDTGSKSQDIDGFLDCTSCDAAERRMEMQNYVSGLSPYMSNWAKCWAAYNFGMQRQAAPVAAQPVEVAGQAPVGWKLVPTEPTEEMLLEAVKCMGYHAAIKAAIEVAPMPEKLGVLRFDAARLNELILSATDAAFSCGKWKEDSFEAAYPVMFQRAAEAKAKLVAYICSLAAPQPAAQPSDDVALKAKRYDWLRHADLDALQAQFYPNAEVPEGEEFDRIIDEAMAKEKA